MFIKNLKFQTQNIWNRCLQFINQNPLGFILGLLLIVIFLALWLHPSRLHSLKNREAWDWLELLVIPLGLLLAGTLFSRAQKKAELREQREILRHNQSQQELKEYINEIQILISEKGLKGSNVDQETRSLARILTINALNELTSTHNKRITEFLQTADLIRGENPTINLSRADLSNAQLANTNFFLLNLSSGDLSNADLSNAKLNAAVFNEEVILSGTNFSNAHLFSVQFLECDLSGADFSGADIKLGIFHYTVLEDTNFSGAILYGARFEGNLDGAKFEGALYNNDTTWPKGFNPKEHGAIFSDEPFYA